MKLTLSVVTGFLLLALCGCARSLSSNETQTATEQTHECDTQAAHPQDLLRVAPGRADEEVLGVVARRVCSAAAEQFPDAHRYRFQLGRALWALNRWDEAAEAFEAAAAKGNLPANFYLAEMSLQDYWESDSESDLQEAIQLLKRSAPSFAPAAERLRQLEFRPEGFQNPLIVTALFEGDIHQLNRSRLLIAVYLQGMHELLAMEWNPEDNDCAARLVEPAIVYHLDSAVAGDPKNFLERAGYDLILKMASLAGKFGDTTYKGDLEKWKAYLKGLGRRDAQHLAREYGCQSPVTRKVYAGLRQFAHSKRSLSEYLPDLLEGKGTELFLTGHERPGPAADSAGQDGLREL